MSCDFTMFQFVGSVLLEFSACTIDEARRAVNDGADYIGSGAAFSTSTKPDKSLIAMDILSQIIEESQLPVVAIGGINVENVHKLKSV
jgi:thiamine-phosphate pyrophosphorylase